MTTTTPTFEALARSIRGRSGLLRLLEALGFRITRDVVPRSAWGAWGLEDPRDLARFVVAGHAGSLDALLLELRPGGALDDALHLAAAVRRRNPARLHLFAVASADYRSLLLGTYGVGESFRHVVLELDGLRASDLELLEEMAGQAGEAGLELVLRQARALDRSRITRRFFLEFRERRSAVAAGWTGLPEGAATERAQLALLFLCRLTFLYFVQRRGALAGDERYIPRLLGEWLGEPRRDGTFYRQRLAPLFFGALNRRPEERDAAARALGALPYLNGGLFERHSLERRFPDLDLPDVEARGAIESLLERYRFTTREAGEGAGFGVDPEMLGRVFEGLMAPEDRGETGSFYTPAPVVNRVVREAVGTYLAGSCGPEDAEVVLAGRADALSASGRHRVRKSLERIRVLDPACGSGAFLLGALWRLADALGTVRGPEDPPSAAGRREIVGRSLHGVDLLDDAALLCSLRLWLALSADDDDVRPLPNLDRRIRQGDALVDPLDLTGAPGGAPGEAFHPLRDPAVRRALRALTPASRRYLESSPGERDRLRARLAEAELELGRSWVDARARFEAHRLRRLRADAADRDLFGDPPDHARRALLALSGSEERARELRRLRIRIDEEAALPFFSFGVHFSEAASGFDLILSNPPWVRAHRWPDRLRAIAARRYEVCGRGGWRRGAALTGAPAGVGAQVDLSLLFLERAIRLLAPAGVLAMLLPAKTFRALYGGSARRMSLRDLEITSIEDHALDQRSIFRADAFAGVLVGRRRASAGPDPGAVRVHMVRRGIAPLTFRLPARDLPLYPDDPASPWLLAPPDAAAALRAMQAAGEPLGEAGAGAETGALRVRRGLMTGANDVLVLRSVRPGLGGLARVEAEGWRRTRREGGQASAARRYRAWVETAAVRPLVRGSGIDAFAFRTDSYIVWCHDGEARPVTPPTRMGRYLERHRAALQARQGWRPRMPLGAVFRLGRESLGHRVAWHDLSDTVRAVALPPTVRFDGADRELVALNTVYFLPVPDRRAALLLAGLLNSLPVRVFARAIAERAKDARFRFFAWTVSCVPLPGGWRRDPAAAELLGVSSAAHDAGGITAEGQARLDAAAGALYRLSDDHMDALAGFDRWLRGEP